MAMIAMMMPILPGKKDTWLAICTGNKRLQQCTAMGLPLDDFDEKRSIYVTAIYSITKATNAISGYVKTIMDRVRSFVIKQYNKVIAPTVDKIFPNARHKLLELKEKANLKLVCLFNKIIGNLNRINIF